ncbi:MAG TPA: cytochrome c biogenesis CcdA family protein [Chloroflexota bacterium]|nr:cytochrome c biogenesis CcdA family protein [Chloroflexota bacterium]
MQKTTTLPGRWQALSSGQKLIIGVVTAVIILLIFGAFNQSNDPTRIQFGLQTQPYFVLAALAFGGGLLSFLSPCTLPVLTAYFAFAFQSGRSQIFANTLAFILGLTTTFTLFGAVGFALGRVLGQNQAILMIVGGSVIMVMGVLSLLGKGFTGVDTSGGGGAEPRSATLAGSYVFGLTFAIGWTACIGPILGAVTTLAYYTDTVWRGMSLLFIYTLGLGLPLLIVSTFFGHISRQSTFWKVLRGKGWEWDTHTFVVALIWALAIWRILVAVVEYLFRSYPVLAGREMTLAVEVGLLLLAVAGAALWTFTSTGSQRTTVHLHSTQLISGALFILIALLMLNGSLTLINGLLVDSWVAEKLIEFEEMIVNFFGQ